ncbi:hypothetical protein GCM10020229_15170 [Kitasatospora albolonga]|uniref:hypothetical protein n=1 Tax=Kitasatospora albolonga TaxID=68173 RepID=UPI00338B2B16
MDYLQEGIGLRAMAQRDPLVEYQREGFDMFSAMMEGIKEESSATCSTWRSRSQQQVEEVPLADTEETLAQAGEAPGGRPPGDQGEGLEAPKPQRLHYTAPSVDGDEHVIEGDFEDGVEDGDGLTRAERRKAARAAKGRRKK